MRRVLRLLIDSWKVCGIALLNAIVILFLAEGALRGISSPPVFQPWRLYLQGIDPQKVYPHRSPSEIESLLTETWNRPLSHRSFVEFMEGAFQGKYVRVHAAGYRETDRRQPWPPANENFNIMFFGGSTAFGYGVGSEETLPFYLQERLDALESVRPVQVYNFGQASFFSTQEQILFDRLLSQGVKIDLAIFFDGLNEFVNWDGEHYYFHDYKLKVEPNPSTDYLLSALFSQTALGRAIGGFHTFSGRQRLLFPENLAAERHKSPEQLAQQVVARYLWNVRNTRTLAAGRRIPVVHIIDPVPFYGEWLPGSQFVPSPYAQFAGKGFSFLASQVGSGEFPAEMTSLLQAGKDFPNGYAFVDWVHYSAAFAKHLAPRVAQIVEGYIKPKHQ